MPHLSKFLLAGAVLATLLANVSLHPNFVQATMTVVNCKCGKASCRKCQTRCRKCPKCENDVCQLSAECVKEKKTCFEVEQKLICIPKVSWPWRKCEQPCNGDCAGRCRNRCGKSKTVNVLNVKSYECPVCKYTWKVCEPPLPKINDELPEQQPALEPDEQQPAAESVDQPGFEGQEPYDPSGSDVPTPPVTKRINN